jgi:hypothetical protein
MRYIPDGKNHMGESRVLIVHDRNRIEKVILNQIKEIKHIVEVRDVITKRVVTNEYIFNIIQNSCFFNMREEDFLKCVGEPCESCLIRSMCIRELKGKIVRLKNGKIAVQIKLDVRMCLRLYEKLKRKIV